MRTIISFCAVLATSLATAVAAPSGTAPAKQAPKSIPPPPASIIPLAAPYETVVLQPSEVTKSAIANLFEKNGLKAELTDKDTLIVTDKGGFKTTVFIDTEKKLIEFSMAFDFDPMASRAKRLELVNQFNDSVTLSRYFISSHDTLVIDYGFTYAAGIVNDSIITSYKRFFESSIEGIRVVDRDKIVK
jgi:hypothetical protein